MNLRVIPRSAIDTSLRLARLPLDAAIRLLPGNGAGAQNRAKIAVDRADATARSVAGAVTLDSELRQDARQRRAAASEREKATELRGQATRTTEEARARSEERSEQAQRRRKEADTRAKRRREQAEKEHESKRSRAVSAEKKRKDASRNVEDRVEEQIEERAPEAQLEALEEKARAEREREAALTAGDEAQRLGDAAAAVKEERKADV